MRSQVTPDTVLARSLADWAAYWDAQGPLNAGHRRRRKFERELRINCAAQGCGVPAADDPTIAEIRSGAKASRDQQSRRNLQHSRERLAMLRKTGHSFDQEGRLVAPALTQIHVPALRPVERPRERRATTRSSGRPSRGDPDPEAEPPPPVEIWRGVAAASARMVQRCERRGAKWAAA
jgi:hypothetical protein